MQLAMREFPVYFGNRRLWIAFAVIVSIFALTGPFGTHDGFGLGKRVVYWTTLQAACWTIALTTIILLGAAIGRPAREDLRIVSAGAALAGVPIAGVVEISKTVAMGHSMSLSGYLTEVVYTVPISILFGTLSHLVMSQPDQVQPSSPDMPGTAALMDRLDHDKRGKLRYLSMQDHYVQVVTTRGNSLVLLRLTDALKEVPPDAGLRIHRSHWVAHDAVLGARRENGRLLLKMADGVELPVSRSYLAEVKAAGLG